MANVQGTREIIVRPAFQDENVNQIEEQPEEEAGADTFSDAASDDGHPKADPFFTFAREHVGPALRRNAPILIFAVTVAAPALSVFVVVTREVLLPAALGNGTLASMSSASRHGYLECTQLHNYFAFLFCSVLVLSCIKEHSVDFCDNLQLGERIHSHRRLPLRIVFLAETRNGGFMFGSHRHCDSGTSEH